MRSRPNPLFALLNRDYYETFDLYAPQRADFHDLVASRMPPGWRIDRNSIWFYCSSQCNVVPLQGWKIHVSATLQHAHETLERVISVLFRYGKSNFKFALDRSTLFLLNSKNWSRSGSGKFITIYPADNREFLELIEELHRATAGLRGPYILSDQRYLESGAVFYRYGGMQPNHVLDISGEKTPVLLAPDGAKVPDQRLPYPITPDWVSLPLPVQESAGNENGLQDGRYIVLEVLGFSNAGGIYKGRDSRTGKFVVIKEARPGVNANNNGYDAVNLLKKEYRLLALLADAEIAPSPVELFQEWEHWFLVEDYVEGVSMASHSASQNILLRTRPAARDYVEWCKTFCALAASLASIMDVLHSRGIVFGDLSTNNLIVTEGNRLKLIDFEGAFELGVDPPTSICTPGFVSSQRLSGVAGPGFSDDRYAMGAVLLAYLLPLTPLFSLAPEARHRIIQNIRQDTLLPERITALIEDLISFDPAFRPAPRQALQIIEQSCPLPELARPSMAEDVALEPVVRQIAAHIYAVAGYERKDRLFPANPKVFVTNPLSLAYGASGIIYALHRITGQVPEPALKWVLSHSITPADYPPGLYIGLSGIALALLEAGIQQPAEDILRLSSEHSLLHASPDLFYGIAGWGMANLIFFLQTQNEFYLKNAVHAGNHLVQTSLDAPAGRYWQSSSEVRLGYAHGASGIALFLLYLYQATSRECFLRTGQLGLEFDLSHACETKDGGLSWPDTTTNKSILYPYWRSGSAGIGITLLRFYRLLGTARYGGILEKIYIDADRKYAASPGLFSGMTGLGEFLLDMYEFSAEPKYLDSARKVAGGIMRFRVERNGIAFPGESLDRLCCDLGTGSAGIALFLDRLLNGRCSSFLPDSLFSSKMTAARSSVAA